MQAAAAATQTESSPDHTTCNTEIDMEEKEKNVNVELAEVKKVCACIKMQVSEAGRTKSLPTSLAPLCQGGAELQRCLIRRPKSREGLRHADKHSMRLLIDVSGPENTNPASCIHVHDLRR